MSKMFLPNGAFACPRSVTDLSKVPADWQDAYAFDPGANAFVMADDLWREIGPSVLEHDELEAAFVAVTAKIDRESGGLRKAAIEDALSAALDAAGVPTVLRRGALALIQQTYAFDIDTTTEQPTVVAKTDYGAHPVSAIVEQFLESDDGAAMRGSPKAPTPHFTSMLKH